MTEAVKGGAALAWRLLATLEGGSLLLVTSALLAYTARSKVARHRLPVKNVLITNSTTTLGQEITKRLITLGCTVSTVTSDATSEVISTKADALIVVGAELKQTGLDGLTQIVTEDVYYNVKLLENLSPLVRTGGCMAWASAGAGVASGSFSGATSAYDAVLKASLQHVARSRHCEPIWTERCEDCDVAAERIVASLLPCASPEIITTYSIRNAVQKLSEYVGRWLKIVS